MRVLPSRVDAAAYIRFASIYREFQEIGEFVEEVHQLANQPRPTSARWR